MLAPSSHAHPFTHPHAQTGRAYRADQNPAASLGARSSSNRASSSSLQTSRRLGQINPFLSSAFPHLPRFASFCPQGVLCFSSLDIWWAAGRRWPFRLQSTPTARDVIPRLGALPSSASRLTSFVVRFSRKHRLTCKIAACQILAVHCIYRCAVYGTGVIGASYFCLGSIHQSYSYHKMSIYETASLLCSVIMSNTVSSCSRLISRLQQTDLDYLTATKYMLVPGHMIRFILPLIHI